MALRFRIRSCWSQRRHSRRHPRDILALLSTFDWNIRWLTDGNSPLRHAAGPVPRSASTCLLIVTALLWYVSDGTKLRLGREGLDVFRGVDAIRAVKIIKGEP